MVLAFRKLTAQAPCTPSFQARWEYGRATSLPGPLSPEPTRSRSHTTFLRSPKKELGQTASAFRALRPRKPPRRYIQVNGSSHCLPVLPQRSPFAWLTKSFTQVPVCLARDRDSGLSSGLGNRGCQVRPAFWKSRPEGIVKGPLWGAQEPTPTPEGRPFVEEVGLRPLVRCKGVWRCFCIVSPHRGALRRP